MATGINAGAKVYQLPKELWVYVGSFLTTRELVRATLVCRRWQHALVGAPDLWTDLSIDLTRLPRSWIYSCSTLLGRSGARPLRLSLRCDHRLLDDPTIAFNAQQSIRDMLPLIAIQFPRLESLSLVIPHLDDDWSELLNNAAPGLVEFNITVTLGSQSSALSPSIFRGNAPYLQHVQVDNIRFGRDAIDAFSRVTDLVYHGNLDESDHLYISGHMPHLQRLTVMGTACTKFANKAAQQVELRVVHHDQSYRAVDAFPRAMWLCISCIDPACATDNAVRQVLNYLAGRVVRRVEIRWTTTCGFTPQLGPAWRDTTRLSVLAEDQPVLTDISLSSLKQALEAVDLAPFMRDVQSLIIPVELADTFARVESLHLAELTLLLPDLNDFTRPLHPLSSLDQALLVTSLPGPQLLTVLRLAIVDQEQPTRDIYAPVPAWWLTDLAKRGHRTQHLVLSGAFLVEPGLEKAKAWFPSVEYERQFWYETHHPLMRPWLWTFEQESSLSL